MAIQFVGLVVGQFTVSPRHYPFMCKFAFHINASSASKEFQLQLPALNSWLLAFYCQLLPQLRQLRS
jgi:hypothetical protein